MPFLHFVSQEDNVVFARVVGDIPTKEVIANLHKLGKSKKIPDNLNLLIDLRRSERSRSYDEADKIVEAYAAALGKYSKRIVLLASEPAFFGASRMTATLAEIKGYDAHATKSEEEAGELLNIKALPSDEQFAKDGFEL